MKRINVEIPPDKHAAFKAETARKGLDMREVVEELIDQWLAAQSADKPGA